MIFHLLLLPGKTNDIIFQTLQKTPFLSHFVHFRVKQSFPQNFATYRCAKLKKKPINNNDRIPSIGFRRTHARTAKYEFQE